MQALNTAGTYNVYVILDRFNTANQGSNTANDIKSTSYTVGQQPQSSDLLVSGSLDVSPNPVTAGNTPTLSFTLKNQGAGSSTDSTTRIQVKDSTNTNTLY